MKDKKLYLLFLFVILLICIVFCVRFSYTKTNDSIYVLIPMTGSLAELGQKIKGAITLYVENNNPAFDIVFVDSASSPDQAIKAINQATVNKERPIVITAFSFIANAVIPIIDEKGGFVFAIATASINPQIKDKHHNFQRISTGIEDVITPLLNVIPSNIKTISIIYSNDEYGIENKKCFSKGFMERSGKILNEVPFNLSVPLAREVIYKIVNDNPSGIFVTGSASLSYINIFNDILAADYRGTIFADAAFSNTVVLKNLGQHAENIVFVATEADLKDASSNKTIQFRKECEEKGLDSYFMTAEAYDAISLVSYLKSSNLTISQETLINLKSFESVAEEIVFLEKGDCWYKCCAVKFTSGEIKKIK